MPTETQFNEWWLWASTATYLIKGLVFLSLAFVIHNEHQKVKSTPTPLGRGLIRFFLFLFCASCALSLIFGLALWARLEGTSAPQPPPSAVSFEARTVGRVLALSFPWGVIISGMMVVGYVREEARRRARGESW